MRTIENEHLKAIGLGVFVSLGTTLGIGVCTSGLADRCSSQPAQVVPDQQSVEESPPEKVGPKVEPEEGDVNQHINLIGALFAQRGERMFPALKEQIAQGGEKLISIRPLNPKKQNVQVDYMDNLLMPVPSQDTNRYLPFEIISRQDDFISIAAVAQTINQAGQAKEYGLLKDACRVREFPRDEHNLQLLSHFPASFDRRDKILLPEPCWIGLRPGWNWLETK